jgi:hypothetical protein
MQKTFKTTCKRKFRKYKVGETIYYCGSVCVVKQVRLLEKTETISTYELTVERIR